ncbi:MAG: preprotein translocase subunit SecA [Candidatus Omnitrophica bacterium]|nr:preprotein translocase subunit SecA [Candidatus Omnitrophota bacterium]MCM8791003.1 preprotein translocase subunit SecA [Candidatus Omnitrophota bacterium]
MIGYILKKVIGTQNERLIRELRPIVEKINSLEPEVSVLSDTDLKAKTDIFKERIAINYRARKTELEDLEAAFRDSTSPDEKEKIKRKARDMKNSIFEDMLPEAFAVVREAARRTLKMRHFDVQLMGGIVLHRGKIAEMATGEGKTLVATLPVYLNALTGEGVHVVTVNDYLAKRDRNWMGPVYEFLGLTVGVIQHDMDSAARKAAYGCDVTYGTNNEFGFDYLRDNMVIHKDDMVQRGHNYAIVDEVDSILIDESRTPLIISGPAEESTDKYYIINKIIPRLKGRVITDKEEIEAKYKGYDLEQGIDYIVNEKNHTVNLTEQGVIRCQEMIGVKNLYEDLQSEWEHHIRQAIRAHTLYKKDVDYVVKDGEVVIVDEFTGRLMPGRRWSDGLHQAVEAKEGVRIERENQTLATITFQNYFRMYKKLAGMTGTAETEAIEFSKIYGLDVVVVPTNKPMRRTNYPDVIYKTEREKFNAVCSEISELYKMGRPVLVGTISIEKSERLSAMLKRLGIPHHVLNAKYHEMEAEIIAKAGQKYAVTIATNMAGRGTDIVLGEGVANLGGLHVLGTERHEARRIDNQLRGRSGRQGDPGSSRFYLSLEDDLMRIFGSDRIKGVMEKLGMEEGQDIQHPLITRAIETAQRRVESHNFEIRKHLLEYDNVMNRQREVIYDERRKVLFGADMKEYIYEIMEEVLDYALDLYISDKVSADQWDFEGLLQYVESRFGIKVRDVNLDEMRKAEIRDTILKRLKEIYEAKEMELGAEMMRHLERMVLLQVVDTRWKDHLYSMDALREGIGLRAYGQRDPLIEYQHEAYAMFMDMISRIKEETIEYLFKIKTVREDKAPPAAVFDFSRQQLLHEEKGQFQGVSAGEDGLSQAVSYGGQLPPHKLTTYKREEPKVGRNDPCPCGSGKKYKKCCGK